MASGGDSLGEYRRKRDFEATPEPAGKVAADEGGRFVIQQHDATRLHWDLRLEAEGVLWSWALPRCVPWDPKRNGLAVHTEDHPVEYLDFEGDIPQGSYGAGHMFVWDRGTYELLSRKEGKLVVRLHGERTRGRYSLFRTRGDRDWMIHRMDPPQDPTRSWPPQDLRPMRGAAGPAESGPGWAWEVVPEGMRVIVTLLPGDVRLQAIDGTDLSAHFPEIRRMGRATGSAEAVLDGVVVGGLDAITERLGKSAPSLKAAQRHGLDLVASDLIWWEGHPCWDEPWTARRERLDSLRLDGPAWAASAPHLGDGPELATASRSAGVATLLGKRVESPYRPGKLSDDWREVDTSTPQ